MIVSAVIETNGPRAAGTAPCLRALRAALLKHARTLRHGRIEAFLRNPAGLDAIFPGIAALPPGLGNDRLRTLRYGDDARFGQTKLELDPEQLRAALVAQRIRCWRALPPSDAFATRVCRAGAGAACCRFLAKRPEGWACAKLTPRAAVLDARAAAGRIAARGDNCRGRADRA